MSPHPPSLTLWLLRRILPEQDREFVLGDLEEEFRAEHAKNPARARMAYRREMLGALATRIRSAGSELRPRRTPPARGRWGTDLRIAVRSLTRQPTVFGVVVVTLGLGVGALTGIWSVVDAVLLRPLPFPEPDRLVSLCSDHPSVNPWCGASPPDAVDWGGGSDAVLEVGMFRDWGVRLRTEQGIEMMFGTLATPGALRLLGADAALGRLYSDEEQRAGEAVALLSHETWQTRFGGDPDIIGRQLDIDGRSTRVVGVLEPPTWIPWMEGFRMVLPLPFDPADEENRHWRGFRTIGRLGPDVSLAAADEELDAVARGLGEIHPETNAGWGVRIIPLQDHIVGKTRGILALFFGAVSLVLLVACANVAGVLLARETSRRPEMAVRIALGASRGDLIRIVLAEGIVLGSVGGVVGIGIAHVLLPPLIALAPPIPRLAEVGLDFRVLGFATLATGVTVLLSSLLPVLRSGSRKLAGTIRSGDGRTTVRAHRGLVVAEIALAALLVVGAGLLSRSFLRLMAYDGGVDRDHLLASWLLTDDPAYAGADDVVQLHLDIATAVEGLPGVARASLASAGPLFGGSDGRTRFVEADRPPPPTGSEPSAAWYDIGPGFFRTMGVPLREGREITRADTRDAPLVAVVNETFARRHWPGESALGKRLVLTERDDAVVEIVAVAADIPPLAPDESTEPSIFWPLAQWPRTATFLVVRTHDDPEEMASAVESRVRELTQVSHVSAPRPLRQGLEQRTATPRFTAALVATFAAMGLLLAAIGIYGVTAYSVSRRKRELGIRISLGLEQSRVRSLLLREAAATALMGAGIGLAAAAALTPLIRSQVVGISPFDPIAFGAALAVALLAGPLAALGPARQATRVDPIQVLRSE